MKIVLTGKPEALYPIAGIMPPFFIAVQSISNAEKDAATDSLIDVIKESIRGLV